MTPPAALRAAAKDKARSLQLSPLAAELYGHIAAMRGLPFSMEDWAQGYGITVQHALRLRRDLARHGVIEQGRDHLGMAVRRRLHPRTQVWRIVGADVHIVEHPYEHFRPPYEHITHTRAVPSPSHRKYQKEPEPRLRADAPNATKSKPRERVSAKEKRREAMRRRWADAPRIPFDAVAQRGAPQEVAG